MLQRYIFLAKERRTITKDGADEKNLDAFALMSPAVTRMI